MSQNFVNDWQSLARKQETKKNNGKGYDKIEEPYKVRREDAYLSMYPSEEGEKYSFSIIPAANGQSFVMSDIMTITRFKFHNPKTNEDYFENMKLPMDPADLFDMSVVDKATKDPGSLTEEDKKTLKDIERHADLVQRYKNLYYAKEPNVNFGWVKNGGKYNNRLRKKALTGFFGVPTRWKGQETKPELKFIQNHYMGFQDKFRTLLSQTASTHDELQPSWYEDYFSNINGYKGIIDVNMGSMKVNGPGATVKLVKLGKDAIEDKGVGVPPSGIDTDSIKFPEEPENRLSHLHYFMGFDSRESIWQDIYVDRFEEAIKDLETFLEETKRSNAIKGITNDGDADLDFNSQKEVAKQESNDDQRSQASTEVSQGAQDDDLPF